MLPPQYQQTADKIRDIIEQADTILLHFHKHPDGDSVSSVMAMTKLLSQWQKQVIVCNFEEVPENYRKYVQNVKTVDGDVNQLLKLTSQVHISLDSANWEQIADPHEMSDEFKQLNRIVIDHHITNPGYGNCNIIMPQVMSTTQVLYYLFRYWQIEITADIAQLLLLGLVTDTGGFRYKGVNDETLRVASKLVSLGAKIEPINKIVFQSAPFPVLKYWAKILENIKYDHERRIVYTWIDAQTIKELGQEVLDYEETENFLLNIVQETDFGFLIKEKQPGKVSVSFRGRTERLFVSTIAEALGGGGHEMAAGCRFKNHSIEQVKEKIFATIDKLLQE